MLLLLKRLVGQREAGGLGLTDVLVVVLVADAESSGLIGAADVLAAGILLVGSVLFRDLVVEAMTYRWACFAGLVRTRHARCAGQGAGAPHHATGAAIR